MVIYQSSLSDLTKAMNIYLRFFKINSNIRSITKELDSITIESCHFNIELYLVKKANSIDELINVKQNVDDSEMCDKILNGLEKDHRLTEHLFFLSKAEPNDYHKLMNDIREFANSTPFQNRYKTKKGL